MIDSSDNQPKADSPDWEADFVEKGADLEHARWSKWQTYMFSKGRRNPDGSWTLPKDLVDRWSRQAETAYKDLSSTEQESDRQEARTYLPLVRAVIASLFLQP